MISRVHIGRLAYVLQWNSIATGYGERPSYSAGSWKNVKGLSAYYVILEGGCMWQDNSKYAPLLSQIIRSNWGFFETFSLFKLYFQFTIYNYWVGYFIIFTHCYFDWFFYLTIP